MFCGANSEANILNAGAQYAVLIKYKNTNNYSVLH